MPRKKIRKRQVSRPARKKLRVRKRKPRSEPAAVHYRSLLAILMFLYMLKLVDVKTFNKIEKALNPTKPIRHRRKKKPKRTKRHSSR